MILKISGRIPQGEQLTVKVNGLSKTLDYAAGSVAFDLPSQGEYNAEITETPAKSNLTFLSMLFYLATVFFRGLLNIFFMSADSGWHKRIRAYTVRSFFTLTADEENAEYCEVAFTYKPSAYNKESNNWDLPVFTYNPDIPHQTELVLNSDDFKNQYVNYLKRLISVESVLAFTMILFLCAAVHDLNIPVAAVMSALILASAAAIFLTAKKQYKKYRLLSDKFKAEEEK